MFIVAVLTKVTYRNFEKLKVILNKRPRGLGALLGQTGQGSVKMPSNTAYSPPEAQISLSFTLRQPFIRYKVADKQKSTE